MNNKRKLRESEVKRYSDAVPYEKRRYWYWTKHGLGPGTLPKDVRVLDVKEGPNRKGTMGDFICLDAVLNTSELKEYDLIELAPSEGQLTEGQLVDPTDDDIAFFENYIIDTLGYEIERKGKTWTGRNHYQIKSLFNGNDREDLREFARELDKLDELMEKRELPMTYSAGLTDDGYITAGLDLDKKYIPDDTDVPFEQSRRGIKLRTNDFDESVEQINEGRLSRYANTSKQQRTIDFLDRTAKKLGIDLRYGTSIGKHPQGVILDYHYQDGVIYVSSNGSFKIRMKSFGSWQDDDFDLNKINKEEVKQALRNLYPKENGELTESAQLNEGPGAGYTIKGKLSDFDIHDVSFTPYDDGNSNYDTYLVKCDITGTASDVEVESYYYGGEINETPVKITEMIISIGKDYAREPKEDDVYDLLQRLTFETVYGGGWSHATFENDLSVGGRELDYGYSDFDLDNISFEFTDDKAVDAIDKYATGGNVDIQYLVDSDDAFATEEEAIEYAKDVGGEYVEKQPWAWKYLGNDEYYEEPLEPEVVWTEDEWSEER